MRRQKELTEPTWLALADALDPAERIDMVALVVGSELVLTDRRLILVRDGANYRPKTGIRSFTLDRDVAVRIGPTRTRAIIQRADETTYLFVRSEQLADVEALFAEVRRRTMASETTRLAPKRNG